MTSTFKVQDVQQQSDVLTITGSLLSIDQDYDEDDFKFEDESEFKSVDILGKPVSDFQALAQSMIAVDEEGNIKKKILDQGGGLPLHEGCTVSIAYSGYFENQLEPFVIQPVIKPLIEDMADNGLLPGLKMAVQSMLVGETAVFLLSYKVMYGELGVPPKIKPKGDCVFYIKLIKSILTSKEGKIDFSEPNMFQRVLHEVKIMYASGSTLHKSNNYMAAIQMFKKAANMLYKCRLADENEEKEQEKMLKKLYINLAVCYNKVNKPLMACTACNELNRLQSLWNNGKVLFQNAKALRMIGDYKEAEKRLLRAMKLTGESDTVKAEYELLMSLKQAHENRNVAGERIKEAVSNLVSDDFKAEVDRLMRNYKASDGDNEIVLPSNLNSDELDYVKQVCIRENLFYNKTDSENVGE